MICFGVLFLGWLSLQRIQINTIGLLCRYLFPRDTFLVVEGKETMELSLNVVLDGKRQMIKAFASPQEENLYYFFLPAGSGSDKIRIIYDLDPEKWRSSVGDFTGMKLVFEEGEGEIRVPINNMTEGEKSYLYVKIMKSDRQPTVLVETKESLNSLLQDRDLKVEANVSVYNRKAETLYNGNVKFKGHGNGSWEHNDKKSWLLDFNEPVSILGMSRGYKYIAISNAQDLSYLRNKFVFDMARDTGLAYSPESEFVNLYVNGEYLGLYLLAEGIEASEERVSVCRDKDELLKRNYSLAYYEGPDEKGYRMPEEIGEDESVGYLLREEDSEGRYSGMECAFKTENGTQFEVLYPEKATERQILNIRNYIEDFQNALESDDGYCDTFQGRKHYSEFIDVDSFIKKYLIEQISKNHDGNSGSSYFYIRTLDKNEILYEGPVWDYDIAFGNITFNEMWREPKGLVKLNPGLDQREEFMDGVVCYYEKYFKRYLENEAERKIREYAEAIRLSVNMDQIRWKDRNIFWKGSFDDGVNDLLSFIEIRKQFLDDIWLNDKVYYRINFVDGDTIVKTVYVEEGEEIDSVLFTYDPPAEENERIFIGWYDEGLIDEVEYNMKVTEDMAFWAKWE